MKFDIKASGETASIQKLTASFHPNISFFHEQRNIFDFFFQPFAFIYQLYQQLKSTECNSTLIDSGYQTRSLRSNIEKTALKDSHLFNTFPA